MASDPADTVTLYGIDSCDTVRKARRWLREHGVAHRFHDLRKDGLDDAMLARWLQQAGWERLLNKRSSSWRQLDESQRAVTDQATAANLMRALPTLIKRPVLEWDGKLLVGFSEASYRERLA
jgi:arsenate reductase